MHDLDVQCIFSMILYIVHNHWENNKTCEDLLNMKNLLYRKAGMKKITLWYWKKNNVTTSKMYLLEFHQFLFYGKSTD